VWVANSSRYVVSWEVENNCVIIQGKIYLRIAGVTGVKLKVKN
jgi:hypothetical protein